MPSYLDNLMLQNYYPGKYDLHTRFQDYYPSWEYPEPSTEFLPLEQFSKRFGINPAYAEGVRGVQPKGENVIGMNMYYTHPRMPYSLDANLSQVADLMLHEGAHSYGRNIPPEEQARLTELTKQQWNEAETPPWIRGLLQRGYLRHPMGSLNNYLKTLWMEGLAHGTAPGGYEYRTRWPSAEEPGEYLPVELPEYFTPYLEELQRMTMPD